jgi:hypothetical protein
MLRWIMNFVVTSILRVVQHQAVGHITLVELELPAFGQLLKWTLPQNS